MQRICMILRFHWCWIPCENTFGWDGCWGFPRCLHVPLYRGALAVDKKFWMFLKQVDTLVNLSVNWNCLGVVWICGRLVCDMPWCSTICLAYILLAFPAWCPPFPGHALGYPASRGIQIQAAIRGRGSERQPRELQVRLSEYEFKII